MGATWGLVVFAALLSCVCGSLTFNGAAWTTFLGTLNAPGVDIQFVSPQVVSGPNNLYYFLACPPSTGCGLFSTNGTAVNLVKAFYPYSAVDPNVPPHCCLSSITVNGKQEVWFGAKTLVQNNNLLTPTGMEPWRSDGTAANTNLVANLDNSTGDSMTGGGSPSKFFALTTTLVAIVNSQAIYVWNDGTKTVAPKITNPNGATNFIAVGGNLYFSAAAVIYKFDGVAAPSILRTASSNVRTNGLFAIPGNTNYIINILTTPTPGVLQFTKLSDGTFFQPTIQLAGVNAANAFVEPAPNGQVYYGCYKDAASKAVFAASVCKIDGTQNPIVEGSAVFNNVYPVRGLFKITANSRYAFGFTSAGNITLATATDPIPLTQFDLQAGTFVNSAIPAAAQTQGFFTNDKFAIGTDYVIQYIQTFNGKNNTLWKFQGSPGVFAATQAIPLGSSIADTTLFNSAPIIVSALNRAIYAYGATLVSLDLTTASTQSSIVIDNTKTSPFLPAPAAPFDDLVAFAVQLAGKTFIPSKDAGGEARVYEVSATGLTLANGSAAFVLNSNLPSWCAVNTRAGGVLLFVAKNPVDPVNKRDLVAFDGNAFTVLSSGQANTNKIYYCQYIPSLDRTVFANSPTTAAGELWVTDHKTAAGTVGVIPVQVPFPNGATLDTATHPAYFNSKLYLSLVIGGAPVLYTLTLGPPLALTAVSNNNAAVAVTGGNLYAHGTNLYWTDTTQLMCFDSAANGGAGAFTALSTFNNIAITAATNVRASMGTAVIFQETVGKRFLRVKGCAVDKAYDYTAAIKEMFPQDGRESPYFVFFERDAAAGDKFYMIGENDDKTLVLTWVDALFASSSGNDRKPLIHGKNLFFAGDDNTPSGQKQVYRVPFPAGMKKAIVTLPTTRLAAVSGLGATPLGNNAQLVGFEVNNINGAPVPFLQDTTAPIQNGAPLVVIPNPLTLTPANQPAIYKSVGPAGATQQAFYPRTYTLQRNAADGWEVPFAKVNGLVTSSSITAATGVATMVDGTSTFLTFDALNAQPSVSFTYVPNFNFGPGVTNQFIISAATGASEAATASAPTTVTFKQFNFPTAPVYAPNPFKADAGTKTTFTLTAVNAEPFYYIDNIVNGQVFADNVALPAAGGFVAATAALQFQPATGGVTTGSFRVRSATMNVVTNPLSDVVANNEVVVSVTVNPPSPTPTVSPTPSPGSGSGSGGSTAQNLVTISVSFDRLISA